MPVCFDRKLALVHIPKTAGSSFTRLLGLNHERHFYAPRYDAFRLDGVTYAPQHLTPRWLAHLIPEFDQFTTVCFTRHPYEKVVSEYIWLKRDFEKRPVRFFREKALQRWIDESLALRDMDHKLPQHTYAKDCDYVFPLARIRELTPLIERALGCELQGGVPRKNVSRHNTKRIAAALGPATRAQIQQLYPMDFEPLGYAFDHCRPLSHALMTPRRGQPDVADLRRNRAAVGLVHPALYDRDDAVGF